ncbi:oxidoreductase [Pontibacter lucknowensis]|uniref:NAD(P)-dependent dehydrogenase, short-chain alcohol dehydrogenase family n=1 Tax=Pontibacter lucknowensis TaxID=1077936 RepID=A0A1N7AT71_9BACT|nr:oxidoreductase [Pontibacter lucknowensis]SIR42309.1 NAD(P)-dependent dehydrogenase, short-chain alcohol dehydrogenase family [Pontibacter lucknowensis]
MFRLENKIVVVTGSNGLLGKKISKACKAQGATVIGADLKFDQSEDQEVFQIKMDITSQESVKEAITAIISKFGRIDGWINNAYPRTKDWGLKIEDIPFDSWRMNVDMHLNGYFLCCREVLETMKKQKGGSVINMSSIYGLVGPDFTVYDGTDMTMPAAYAAIKGGINNLSRYLAAAYGPYGIRVNCVSPGGIFDNQPASFVESYGSKVPLRRMGNAEDIMGPIVFLLTDESSYITGHNLLVDGGWTAI